MSKRTIGEWFDDGSHAADEEVGWLLNGEYRRQAGFLAPHLRAAGQAGVLEVGCRSGLLARTLAILEPGLHYVGYEASGQHIGLVPGGAGQGMTSPVAYWSVPDIEAKLAELTAAGATVNEPVRDVGGGRLVASVTDPDGNVLGVVQDR